MGAIVVPRGVAVSLPVSMFFFVVTLSIRTPPASSTAATSGPPVSGTTSRSMILPPSGSAGGPPSSATNDTRENRSPGRRTITALSTVTAPPTRAGSWSGRRPSADS